jgi:hypothetical protein
LRNSYDILIKNPEAIGALGISRLIWEDIIKMGLKEVGYDDMY